MGSTTGPRRCQPPQIGRSGTKVIGHTIFKMNILLGNNAGVTRLLEFSQKMLGLGKNLDLRKKSV